MRRVVVESPFTGKGDTKEEREADAAKKQRYLAACLRDCYRRGESPYASHAIGPLALNDDDPEERALGMSAVTVWRSVSHATVVYRDLGIAPGMEWGVKSARNLAQVGEHLGMPPHVVEIRSLGEDWDEQ